MQKKAKKLVYILVSLGILASCLIGTIDRSSFNSTTTISSIEARMNPTLFTKNDGGVLEVGWAKVNITPKEPIKLVGYQPRGPYVAVHDSLFVRAMVFKKADQKVAVVSVDLLLFPPLLRQELARRLPKINWEISQMYFSASHTHTGFGGWDNSPLGGILMGGYQPAIVEKLCNQVLQVIQEADSQAEMATLSFGKVNHARPLENRLDKAEAVDGWIRVIQAHQQATGQKGLIMSYSAHATSIDKKIHQLSGDYPAEWIHQVEASQKVDFALFCAGMVGSHRFKWMPEQNFELANVLADTLTKQTLNALDQLDTLESTSIQMVHIPITLPAPQLRISSNFKARSWVFDQLMGTLEAKVSVMQLGDIVMLGMPCDFSGEIYVDDRLEERFHQKGLYPIITSFNGYYIGYITADEHYDTKAKEEVRVMNWVGPNMGTYFSTIIQEIAQQL